MGGCPRDAVDRARRSRRDQRATAAGTELLLIESPEPLPINRDVTFTLFEVDGTETEVATAALLHGALCRAVIVPMPRVRSARGLLALALNPSRFRAVSAATDDRFRQDLSIELTL